MSQPVWTLSVDLQTKTATFQSGMADAAKAARGSFTDIKEGAREMTGEMGYSMSEARHSVMIVGEEFGVHLPRALTSFIASLGPVGGALEAAFPFLAIVLGATLLLEHLSKLKQEGDKLTESQVSFGTTVANVLNSLDAKLLQAGIRTDDLNHNHLGALEKQLALIDHASLEELVTSFGVVSKAADATFAELKTSWYQWGQGSAGAKSALEHFKTAYDSLLAQGKDKEANDLLAGTKQSAEHVLDLMKQVKDNQTTTGTKGTHNGDYQKFEAAKLALQKQGIGYTEKEVSAQEILVQALEAQVSVYDKVQALKAAQQNNAKQETGDKMSGDADKAFREQAQAQQRGIEETQKLWEENYKRAVSELQENERMKIEATDKGSAARLAAIDAAIKEENSKGLQETAFYKSLLVARVDAERQMDAEKEQLAEKQHDLSIRSIDEATKDAESMRKIAMMTTAGHAAAGLISKEEEQQQIRAVLEREQTDLIAAHQQQMAEQQRFITQMRQMADQAPDDKARAHILLDVSAAQEKLTATQRAFNEELARNRNAIAQSDIASQKLNNTWLLFFHQTSSQLQSLTGTLNGEFQRAIKTTFDGFGQGVAKSIVEGKSLGSSMRQVAREMTESMINHLVQWGAQDVVSKLAMKGAAATLAGANATASFAAAPWPVDIGAPAFGASAMASALAFEQGGIVPGVGRGDVVPAMLEPGEGVLTKKQMEGLKNSNAQNSGPEVHIHHHATYHVQAFDSEGVDKVLQDHGQKFTDHAMRTIRRMNR